MNKYITEKTLRNIQIMNATTPHLLGRRRWIELACEIAYTFQLYCGMRLSSDVLKVDIPIEDWEETIGYANKYLGTQFSLSDMCMNPDENADDAIFCYKIYKEAMKIYDGGIFSAPIAERLFKELYEENPMVSIFGIYLGQVAEQILRYMCESIDYDTFIKNFLAIKIVPNQKAPTITWLKYMIKFGEKWVSRYKELVYEELAKKNI